MSFFSRSVIVGVVALGWTASLIAISPVFAGDAAAQAKAKSIKKVFNKSAKGGPKPITPTFNKAAGIKPGGGQTNSASPIKVKLKNAPASPKAAFNKAATPPLKPTFNQAAAPTLKVKFNAAAGKGAVKSSGKVKTDSATASHQLKKPAIHPKPSTVSTNKKKADQQQTPPPPPKPKGPTP